MEGTVLVRLGYAVEVPMSDVEGFAFTGCEMGHARVSQVATELAEAAVRRGDKGARLVMSMTILEDGDTVVD